jgi:hypothetical protein
MCNVRDTFKTSTSFKNFELVDIKIEHSKHFKILSIFVLLLVSDLTRQYGTLAEWLRRSPAKAVGYACVSSNLTGVD